MKKFYALFLALTACILAHAQVSKGSLVLGGNLSYDGQSSTTTGTPTTGNPPTNSSVKEHGILLNPSIGKAIRDNLVLGIDLNYIHQTTSTNASGSPISSTPLNQFSVGVFIRRYIILGNGFSLFGQAEIDGGYVNETSRNPPSSSPSGQALKESTVNLQLYPGIAYALNHHWQVETGISNFLAINYTHSKATTSYTGEPDQVSTGHEFNITGGITGTDFFVVGVRYIIGGK